MDASRSPLIAPQPEVVFDQGFIVIYRALDAALCRAITTRFDADAGKEQGKIGRQGGDFVSDADTKLSWDLGIDPVGPWAEVFAQIQPRIQACVDHYVSRGPILQSFDLQPTGYKIQMYPKQQGYFRWHADSVGENARDRVVAMVLYLNDVARGGDTEFFHQGLKVAPKAGHLVLFPTGWNYMHCGHAPESGDKYIIQNFIKIRYPQH
jgi:hypothetical protein